MSDALPLLESGPKRARVTIVLAHGAGAGMDTPFLTAAADGLGERGFRVVRFEFPYQAKRRLDGKRRGPDRTDVLLESYRGVVERVRRRGPLVVGGKSMGGRMASMLADELSADALVCLGYPFHPPGRKDQLRTAHLETLATPALVVQGTRDPFGGRDEVSSYRLSPVIRFHWVEDGDHDLRSRKSSGFSAQAQWEAALDAISSFLQETIE